AYSTTVTGVPNNVTVTLQWTVTNKDLATCTAFDQLTLTNTNKLSDSKAGNAIVQCGNNVFQLSANQPATGETGKWTGPANVTFGDATVYNTTATVAGAAPQTVTLTWTISNGVCT
ncbi:hypothetical protein, partial [Chitinophaga varians]|uniref:hypothetical protein n=1 Tax=Chitinophaga varians TaxID=2202339 RepID=UPI00165EDA34